MVFKWFLLGFMVLFVSICRFRQCPWFHPAPKARQPVVGPDSRHDRLHGPRGEREGLVGSCEEAL